MRRQAIFLAACAAVMLSASGAAFADKPAWAGGDKHGQKGERAEERRGERAEERHGERRDVAVSNRFDDDARHIIGDYYGRQARAGKCPPGLAKKRNGCMPPGQAKKWAIGHPLPDDVRYYALPPDLLRRLPPPPPEHRYVQVAGDILMIAVGSSMVVDAVQDIMR